MEDRPTVVLADVKIANPSFCEAARVENTALNIIYTNRLRFLVK